MRKALLAALLVVSLSACASDGGRIDVRPPDVDVDTPALREVKARIASAFTVKDLDEMRFCLGIEVVRDRSQRTLQISQRPYVEHLAAKFHMTSPHPVVIPLDPALVLAEAERAGPVASFTFGPPELSEVFLQAVAGQ